MRLRRRCVTWRSMAGSRGQSTRSSPRCGKSTRCQRSRRCSGWSARVNTRSRTLPTNRDGATVPGMTTFDPARLDRAVESLPRNYAGPGGAVAVVREGEAVVRHSWGWANAERRIAFTPRTLFRMCSITKQFTCGVVLDAFPDPSVLDGDVRACLPALQQPAPGALHLCHNQSGL